MRCSGWRLSPVNCRYRSTSNLLSTVYIQPDKIVLPDQVLEDGAIIIRDGIIAEVGAAGGVRCPHDALVVDAEGLILAPGYVDMQLNGAFGCDFTDDPETIWEVARKLPMYGVTSFLPTIITSPPDRIARAQEVLRKGPPADFEGALPIGLHLEGPFLNPAKRGAHNLAHLRLPDLSLIKDWSPEDGVLLVTLAPELPGAPEMIAALRQRGVIVSAGHSMSTYEEAAEAFGAGVGYGTHLFNAMPPLDHRNPGLPLALLDHGEVTVGIIADGIHVHPAAVAMAFRMKGAGKLNLVSDAMSALGMPPGRYVLGDNEVISDGVSARRPNGPLAGSLLSMDQAVRNLIRYTHCSIHEAIATATSTPAALLNHASVTGSIAPGHLADVILLTPDLRVVSTMVRGRRMNV